MSGGYCESTPVARLVSENGSAVTVAVDIYAVPPKVSTGSNLLCPATNIRGSSVSVTLDPVLGKRALIDSVDSQANAVLDPATVLEPTYLPAGYSGGQPYWGRDGTTLDGATRNYAGSGSTLTVTVGDRSLNRPIAIILEHTTVRGHAATVSVDPGFAQDILIAWNEDPDHAVTVYQASYYKKGHPALSVAQLKRIASSLQ
jgi:hypothetical protein